jgi:hypothetical protein
MRVLEMPRDGLVRGPILCLGGEHVGTLPLSRPTAKRDTPECPQLGGSLRRSI